MARNKDNSKGARITPSWKPKGPRKAHTPNPNGDRDFRQTCAGTAWAEAADNLAAGGLKVRGCHSLIFDPPLATKVCCPLRSLAPTAHFGKSCNQAAANASIFQESKQTKYFLQGKLRSLLHRPQRGGCLLHPCVATLLVHQFILHRVTQASAIWGQRK